MTLRHTVLLFATLLCACGPAAQPDGGTANDAGAGSDAGASTDAGTDAGVADAGPPPHCPTVELPSVETQTYDGNTTGKPDLIHDVFAEFGKNVPDDALAFKAPTAGTYRLTLKSTPQTNGGCYVGFGRNANHTRADCPAAPDAKDYGSTGLGFLGGANEFKDFTLQQNEELLFYFGCTYWSIPEKFGAYQVTLVKQ